MNPDPRTRRHFLRDAGLLGAAASAAPLLRPSGSEAADPGTADLCPHPNPIVHENRCTNPDTFSSSFQVTSTSSVMGGFARRTSVNIGESVDLAISGPNLYLPPSSSAPVETVEVDLYRLGYYDGLGGRLIWSTSGPVSTFQKTGSDGKPSNDGSLPSDLPSDGGTGLSGRALWRNVVTVPGTALATSGVYLAKLKGNWLEFPPDADPIARSGESHVVIVVRDDARPRDVLVLLPTNTWQAYNYWSGRSTYTYNSRYGSSGSLVAATGTERAAKVSFDRPHNNWVGDYNWVLRTEFPAIWWLERHGYDVAYTEDVALGLDPSQALPAHSKGVVILGHGEYWNQGLRDGLEGARDAGTSIYNFGANTAYWRVRYETIVGAAATTVANARVMVCYKTIEGGGSTATTASPSESGTGGTASNESRIASLADPVSPTTTWRDPGKGAGVTVPGTPQATPATYTGPNRPEAGLLGVQYIGDDDARNRGITVPADNGAGEFAGHRAWRHTTVPAGGTEIGKHLLGWEWDSIPAPGSNFGGTPPATKSGSGGVQRLSETDPRVDMPSGTQTSYLLDAGRQYSANGTAAQPPAGGSGVAHAITYTAPSGALVFSSGTIQWSWGLGPHYLHRNTDSYASPAVDTTDVRISQATTNLLADGGIVPLTPEGLLFDPDPVEPTTPPATTPVPDTPSGGGDPPAAPTPQTPAASNTPPAASTPAAALPVLRFALVSARISSQGIVSGRVTAATKVPRTVKGTVELTLDRKRIAKGTFTVATNRSAVVRLKLSLAARAKLRRAGKLGPIARIEVLENGKTTSHLSRLAIKRAKRADLAGPGNQARRVTGVDRARQAKEPAKQNNRRCQKTG